jgi:hypothetical protein
VPHARPDQRLDQCQPRLEQADFVRVALIVSMVSLFSASYLDKVFSRFDAISDRVIRGDIEEKETT